jgi:hypothetical protein
MAKTVYEVWQQLESSRQELAVWNEVVAFLSKFVDTEQRAADAGITTEGCVSRTAPQSVIQAVRSYIEEKHVEPLMGEIEGLSNQQIVETENDQAQRQESAEAKSGGKVPRQKTPRIVRRRVVGTAKPA